MNDPGPRPSVLLLSWLGLGVGATLCVVMFRPAEFGTFVLATIVCTAGLSLALWIPAWLLIGMFIYYLFRNLVRRFRPAR